jgi:BirA family biotin operon repressor/biotin-[acetyl-CoA-carboxylase] ligase
MHRPLSETVLPLLRLLSHERFHSGEALAQTLGVTRASIFNFVGAAQALGVSIQALRGRGYRLATPVAWLEVARIRAALGTHADRFDLQLLDTTDSTNTLLMRAASSGAADGSVVCAEYQYAGRGRRGRQWHAVLGGSLTFSLLLRFDGGIAALAGLSLAAGVAIARVLNRHSRFVVQLKWPNDVLVGYRKLAGILVEVQGDIQGPSFAVVGIGLNVRLPTAQRESIDQAVIDLDEMQVDLDRNALLAACLVELADVTNVLRREGFAALRGEWESHHAHAGQAVTLSLPDGSGRSGIALGVDVRGALLLQDARGQRIACNGGEIRLRAQRGQQPA